MGGWMDDEEKEKKKTYRSVCGEGGFDTSVKLQREKKEREREIERERERT